MLRIHIMNSNLIKYIFNKLIIIVSVSLNICRSIFYESM